MRAVAARAVLDQRRAVAVWGGALGALGAFMAAIYPSVSGMVDQLVEHYPAGLKQAFDVGAMTTVEGYVHAEMFSLIVPLAIAVFAIRSVTGPTVGAEERGELDTTLALPRDPPASPGSQAVPSPARQRLRASQAPCLSRCTPLDLGARLADRLAPLRFVSAFHYYGAPLRDGIDISSFAVMTGAAVVLAAAGAMLLQRRDIRQR